MLISVDGIIGAGKSTVLTSLKARGYSVFLEPFEKNPVLPLFYRDPQRFAAITQTVFFPLRVDLQMSIPCRGVHFIERSAYSDRYCFGEMLKSEMISEEWDGYCLFFDLLAAKFNLLPDITIILDIDPEICLQRIIERGREMEKGITIAYLQRLRRTYYENISKLGKKVFVLKDDIEENIAQLADEMVYV